jgi:hypothetical protein
MNVLKIIPVILISLLLISCNKEDNQATGVGDVMIISKKSGTTDVYGLSLYAYSFSSFNTVTAQNAADPGKTYTLKANQGFKTNFLYSTPDAEFTSIKPAAGTFNFSAIFDNGVTQEFQDELTATALAPAIIDSCFYNPTKHAIRVVWKPVTDADSYTVGILDSTEVVFGSYEFNNTVKSYTIGISTTGWISGYFPEAGTKYKVRVYANLYEVEKNIYNHQSLSIAESETVWGE